MDECLERFFQGKDPLNKKWRAYGSHNRYMWLMHYHHVVLGYDFQEKKVIHQWYERPTDKRGLDAALEFLKANSERLPAYFV